MCANTIGKQLHLLGFCLLFYTTTLGYWIYAAATRKVRSLPLKGKTPASNTDTFSFFPVALRSMPSAIIFWETMPKAQKPIAKLIIFVKQSDIKII